MASEWIEHVKKVSKQKKITYKEAMKVAKATYKPKGKKMDDKKKMPKKKKNMGEGVAEKDDPINKK
jgi:hypothetical protein